MSIQLKSYETACGAAGFIDISLYVFMYYISEIVFLKAESQTWTRSSLCVPGVTIPVARINPPAPALWPWSHLWPTTPLRYYLPGTTTAREKGESQTKTFLPCGQTKSEYENDASPSHIFCQQGISTAQIRFLKHGSVGLTNPKMAFKDLQRRRWRSRDSRKDGVYSEKGNRNRAQTVQSRMNLVTFTSPSAGSLPGGTLGKRRDGGRGQKNLLYYTLYYTFHK